jgi:heptosyltransferase-2
MIGDVLTSSILFELLRLKYPKVELHYLINSHTFPVVENNPFIDHFIFITPEIEKSKLKFYRLLKSLNKEKYDVIIDAYGVLSSNLISYFSNAKLKISYHKKYTSFIYTNSIKRIKKTRHKSSLAIENRMRLLEPLNVDFKNIEPKIHLKKQEVSDAKKYLISQNINLKKTLFMISVLGSSPTKTYPFQYMANVLDTIININPEAQLLFNYIPNQIPEAKVIYNLCKPNTQKQIFFSVYGKNLREFLAITKHCNSLIGNEGGANNMAKALGLPTFTIFSPYLNKQNWFGESEKRKHIAIHLSDYINYNMDQAKQIPEKYYIKLKFDLFKQKLLTFLNDLN